MSATRFLPALALLALLALSSPASAQVRFLTIQGEFQSDGFGSAVAGAGDLDGDGIPDVWIGAQYAPPMGRVRAVSGRDGAELYTVIGTETGRFGMSVASAGDVDGDGVEDLIAGAMQGTGSARVCSGATGAVLYTFIGPESNGQYGRAVAGAGDVDGDGHADFWIGAPVTQGGLVELRSGLDGSLSRTLSNPTNGGWFGATVAGAGDADGDGVGDVVVGSFGTGSNKGSARVYSGRTGALLHTVKGQASSDFFGTSVAWLGDLDGDGRDEFAVGASSAGTVTVFSGLDASVVHHFVGDAAWDGLSAVASAGDVDADGVPDLVLGAPYYDGPASSAGYARVHSGVDGALLFQVYGEAKDNLGWAVAGARDVNGDGLADVLVGAPRSSAGQSTGHAVLFLTDGHFLGDEFCAPAVPNSTGTWGRLWATGSDSVAANDLTLVGSILPQERFAMLLASPAQDYVVGPGGSDGILCLGAPIARFPAASTGPGGVLQTPVDLTAIPGHGAVAPGETWNFQVWHRDFVQLPTSNFTEAVRILFL